MKQKTKTIVGILAAASCALSYLALTPIIGEMVMAFPDAGESLVQMVITLPTFMFILFSPIAGILTRKITGKNLLLIALGLYLIGGILPFFFHSNVWQLLAGSVIVGCGTGIMMPTINSVICAAFDGSDRGRLMGLNATFTALGAMVFIFVSGLLSSFGWHFSFLTFLLVIPMAMTVLLMEDKPSQAAARSSGSGFEMNPYIAFLFVIGFVYFTAHNAFNTNSALYLSEWKLGGSEQASMATMCSSLGGILGGLLFGKIAGKVKNQIATVALVLAGIGFLLPALLHARLPIFAGGVLVGSGFAIYNAAGTLLLSRFLKPENNDFTTSVYMALINLGGSLSPILVNSLSGVFGEGVWIRFLLCGIAISISAAASLLVNRAGQRR